VLGACGAAALVLVGGPMLQGASGTAVANLVPSSITSSSSELSGRADAVSGDLLRVNGQLVRLAGVEAPEPKQPCLKSNGRRWSCGTSARSALDKMLRGKTVTCSASGNDDAGRTLATCNADGTDIAAELVRAGHVFSAQGFLNSYNAAEDAARAAKAGLWQGETVRPQEWRDRVWEEAKRTAPEGCPIKGYVRADDRTYAMPWSTGYNGGKIRTVRGDRWFCSEEEARAAGFKLASRS
jgi:endonuclease YncB( thermonuclease family)